MLHGDYSMQMRRNFYWAMDGNTKTAWSASRIKQNKVGYSDVRNSLLGDSFRHFLLCEFWQWFVQSVSFLQSPMWCLLEEWDWPQGLELL